MRCMPLVLWGQMKKYSPHPSTYLYHSNQWGLKSCPAVVWWHLRVPVCTPGWSQLDVSSEPEMAPLWPTSRLLELLPMWCRLQPIVIIFHLTMFFKYIVLHSFFLFTIHCNKALMLGLTFCSRFSHMNMIISELRAYRWKTPF